MPKQVDVKPETAQMWKDEFLRIWDHEYQTTLRVLGAYPENKLDLRPHQKLRTAKELAWTIVTLEPWMIDGLTKGEFSMEESTEPPTTMKEIITKYEKIHKDSVASVRRMNETDLNKMVNFFVAPRKTGKVKSSDILTMMVLDHVHHRGQFSVYLRIADGKVPSIYGATADEDWR